MNSAHSPAKGRLTTLVSCLLAYFLVFGSQPGSATPPPAGVAPLISPEGGFAIDGDLLANVPGANIGDWVTNSLTGGGVLSQSGVPLNSSTTFHYIDQFGGNDLIFGGGLKWTDNPTNWTWTTGKASGKTDINNVLLHVNTDIDAHRWVVIAADRASTSGDSYIDFEFLQNPLTRTANGKFTSAGPHGGRSTNDLLLSLAFTSGGSTADFFAWRWQPSGSGFAYVDVTASLPVGRVFVALNTNNAAVPYRAFDKTNYSANAFAEAAVDLTALLSNIDPCSSFGFKTIMVKTKTSQSGSASINDFLDPIQFTLQIGPSADAGPDQTRCTEGDSTQFPLAATATAGLSPIVSTTWSVVNGTATIDSADSLSTAAHVLSATATLRLTVVQANGCTEMDDIVLNVAPLPACSITGAATVCPRVNSQFRGPPGMSAYLWSLSGNGAISGAPNQQTVTVTPGSPCGESFTLVLNVTSNGCSSVCATDVSVNDTNAPSLICPPDLTLECPANTATNATGAATAQDDCGQVLVTFSDATSNSCGGTLVILRTWTATDTCSNIASRVQTITVRDTRSPSLTIPANKTLECPADTSTTGTGLATAVDACGAVTVSHSDSVSNSCGGAIVITRTWTATDPCGNSTNRAQTISVRDTTQPTLLVPANAVLQCPADTSTNATGVATAEDTCSQVNVSFIDFVTNNCAGTKIIARRWTATDQCNNSITAVQSIILQDTNKPALLLPASVVLDCPADTSTNNTGVATSDDTCSAVTITYRDSVTNKCGNTKVIARTWTAIDGCSNTISGIQTITVRDITPPSLICPADLVRECPAITTTNATGVAVAQDQCSAVIVTFTDNVITNCGTTRTIFRTWTATDACNNSTNCVQTIIVQDTTNPAIICPPDVTLECPANTSASVTGMATAQDGCNQVTISHTDSVSNSCAGAQVILRTWRAIDACGNSNSCVQTITVRDTTPPSLTIPVNLTLECPADTGTNATGVATAQNTCGSVTVGHSDLLTTNCAGTKVIARTWTARDECGNTTSRVQTITVRDTAPPSLVVPINLVLECPAITTTNVTGVPIAQDGCGMVTVSFSDLVTTNCGNTKVIARTWTVRDECGNSTNRVQTITVRDTTKPTITCPPNRTLECPANTSTNNTGVATATDGCGTVTVSFSDSVSNSCGGTYGILRTWRATDACGNSDSCVQTITVHDATAPSLICPANVVLECPAADTRTNVTGAATAQDACSAFTVSYSDVTTTNCGATKIILRTWTATDACGNSANCAQTITVRDTINPTIACPPNRTLDCPADTGTNATGVATAQDTCSAVTMRYSDSVSNSCGGAKVILRTWTATDACGNNSACVQTITVRDIAPPTITCPASVTVECGASTSPGATGTATASDTCNSPTVSYTDATTNFCGGTRIITRTWTATDACGNKASCTQTITVRDTTPPALTLPANLVLECPGDTRTNVTGVAVSQDVCGSVTLIYSDVVSNSCGLTKTVLRQWTATDPCGNRTNGVQTITVVDTRKPTVTAPSISVQCADDVPAPHASLSAFLAAGGTASDPCSPTLTFSLTSDSGLVGRCPGTVTRVYRVTDECGNFGDATQRITVDDTIPPVLTCPTNAVAECSTSLDPAITGRPTTTDNCSTNIGITYTDTQVQSSYSVNFYAADPAANSAPYLPTYVKLAPASLPCPASAVLTGRAADPLRNAVAFGPDYNTLDALTALSGEGMYFGQVVPFEAVVTMWGAPGPERGTIEFSAGWSTHTTSNDELGFDKNYMVYCAFVDTHDPGAIDPDNNARVESYSAVLVNQGTIDEQIKGTFRVSGMDVGDQVVVEIWVVLKSTFQGHAGGGIAAQLDSAAKYLNPPVPISIGSKTISISANKISPLPAPQPQPPLGPPPNPPPQPPGIPGPGRTVNLIDRTWTATDDCANRSTCVQRITVRDATPPVILAPPDVVLECPADTGTNVTGAAVAQDTCGSVSVFYYSDSVTNGCGGSKVVSRTWTATDDSGNSTNVLQTITVRDAPPTITCPPNATVECGANTLPAATGTATAQDECSAVMTVNYSDAVTSLCGGSRLITRTWTATDACGNSNSCVQTITARDTTPPTIACPPNAVRECGTSTAPTATGFATAQDECSAAMTVNYSDGVMSLCGGSRIITRTWTATDACGNSNSCVQAILVRDTTPPTLVCAPNRIVQPEVAWSFEEPVTTDGCSAVTVQVINTVTNTTGNNTLIATRTWQATDACGNTSTCQQTIAMLVGQPPVITSQPKSQTVTLGSPATLGVTAAGSSPLAYQWRCNGTNLAGATSSSLTMSALQLAQAGLYDVVVSNPAGTVTSSCAVLNIAPKLSIQPSANGITLTWSGPYILQSATNLAGPYTDVPGATSPYYWNTATNPPTFFNLRAPPFSLTSAHLSGGQFQLTCAGVAGCNFVIQASTNLSNWNNLHTNTSPFTLVDSNAWQYPRRFYRALLAH